MKHREHNVWKRGVVLLLPSLVLLPVFVFYVQYDGTAHFFLHTLMGWNVGLILLLALTTRNLPWSRWDGITPFLLALYALTPDFIYVSGPFHRDWMDIFLFHVSLDEILPIALPVLALLWLALLAGYLYFRCSTSRHHRR